MTNYNVNLSDVLIPVSDTLTETIDFLFAEEVVGTFLSTFFTVYYIENVKAISIDMVNNSAVVYQIDEEYEWIGYNAMQNLRTAKIEADVRVQNGTVQSNGQVYQSSDIINLIINTVQKFSTSNITISGDRVIYVKLENASNLQMRQRGEDWIEFIFEVRILTNNF
jgi:hypothetical protein